MANFPAIVQRLYVCVYGTISSIFAFPRPVRELLISYIQHALSVFRESQTENKFRAWLFGEILDAQFLNSEGTCFFTRVVNAGKHVLSNSISVFF